MTALNEKVFTNKLQVTCQYRLLLLTVTVSFSYLLLQYQIDDPLLFSFNICLFCSIIMITDSD